MKEGGEGGKTGAMAEGNRVGEEGVRRCMGKKGKHGECLIKVGEGGK